MVAITAALVLLASFASASPVIQNSGLVERNNDGSPILDLGKAGVFRGIKQNNGTVNVSEIDSHLTKF